MALNEKIPTSEKRRHPRFNVDLPIKYSRTHLFPKQGRVANASEGGLLVHLSEQMEIGQRLSLQLFFPSRSELNIIKTSVQVVWMGIHLKKDWVWDYRTGVRFVNISMSDITKLKNFLIGSETEPIYTS